MARTDRTPSPMKLAEFHILLVLAAEQRHGLGIAEAIDEATEGAVQLGPGTLYRSLKDLANRGLIQDVPAPEGEDDPRRRFYGIMPEGRRRVAEEAERLARVVQVARENRLIGDSADG